MANRKAKTGSAGVPTPATKVADVSSALSPEDLFALLKDKSKHVNKQDVIDKLKSVGLPYETDTRLRRSREALAKAPAELTEESFVECLSPCFTLIERAYRNDLAIKDWPDFVKDMTEIFEQVKRDYAGKGTVASYIPELASANPNDFAISITTVSGQQLQLGDSNKKFCLQSMSKPLNYLAALSSWGRDKVHKHVGREPSGKSFNAIAFLSNGMAHNPCVNAGAMTVTSLLHPHRVVSDRFKMVVEFYEKMAGAEGCITCDMATYLSEQATADRNFALCYHLKQNDVLPSWIDDKESLMATVELYFQLCSCKCDAIALSNIAATLANKGTQPMTGAQAAASEYTRNTLSILRGSGMYDYSGEFTYLVGLPAKSGVSGGVFVVVPGIFGMAVYSPPLDKAGNSVKGVAVCQELVKRYSVHMFEMDISAKKNISNHDTHRGDKAKAGVLYAAARGDLRRLRQAFIAGCDVNLADHDDRSLLHLAAASGCPECVEFLLERGADSSLADHWKMQAVDLAANDSVTAVFTERGIHSKKKKLYAAA